MSKNIAFILGSIDPSIGGVQRVTWTLSKFFEQNGYECFYVYCGVNTPLIDESRKIHLNFNSDNHIDFYNRFYDFVNKNKISIIIDQDYYSPAIIFSLKEIKKEIDIKLIYCYHRNPFFEDIINGYNPHSIIFKNRIKKLIHKDIYSPAFVQISNLCYKYVVLSDSYIKLFSQRYNINKNQITAIINPTPFNISEIIDLDSKEKIVFIVTRFVEKIKNIKASLRIWKNLESSGYNGWKLVIAGYGEDEENIKNYAEKIHLKSYSFIGKIDNPIPYYMKSSIIMMTSNCEGYPMTLIEGMQFGCVPIVFNNFSSLKDIITNNKNGVIISSEKETVFSKKLLSLMNNNINRKTLAFNAIEWTKNNSINQIGTIWLDLLNKE